jgi:hypothetical protein
MDRTKKKSAKSKILNYWRTEFVLYPLMTQRVVVPSIYWREDALYVNIKIHRNSCAWLGDTDRHSVRLPYLLKNCLVFGPYRPEKEICVLNQNCKFRFQINLDRHSQRPIWKICHLPDPPLFSLFSTFKYDLMSIRLQCPCSCTAQGRKSLLSPIKYTKIRYLFIVLSLFSSLQDFFII